MTRGVWLDRPDRSGRRGDRCRERWMDGPRVRRHQRTIMSCQNGAIGDREDLTLIPMETG